MGRFALGGSLGGERVQVHGHPGDVYIQKQKTFYSVLKFAPIAEAVCFIDISSSPRVNAMTHERRND